MVLSFTNEKKDRTLIFILSRTTVQEWLRVLPTQLGRPIHIILVGDDGVGISGRTFGKGETQKKKKKKFKQDLKGLSKINEQYRRTS